MPGKERPMKSTFGAALRAGAVAFPLLWAGCNGSATQTTNGGAVHGTLVNSEGEPVPGAEVRAYTLNAIGTPSGTATTAALAVTDGQGRYDLKDLAEGSYNIFARQGSGSKGLLIPEVEYGQGELDLGVDTLVAPGSIVGRAFVDSAPAEEIFCYIPGSPLVAVTGEDGRFTLGNVPPGSYALKYVGQDLQSVTDSEVVVVSDEVTLLDPVNLRPDTRLQPTAPTGLKAAMIDTAKTTIRLTWNASASGDVMKYRIHKKFFALAEDSIPVNEYSADIPADSSVYYDSTGWRLFLGRSKHRGEDSAIVEFTVSAIDSLGNPSRGVSNAARVQYGKADWMRTEASLDEITGLSDTMRCQDTLVFVVDFTNPVVDTAYYRWYIYAWKGGQKLNIFFESKQTGQLNFGTDPDTLTWWYSKGYEGLADNRTVPDSISVIASVQNGHQGRYNEVLRVQDLKMDGKGCYRKVGADHYKLD